MPNYLEDLTGLSQLFSETLDDQVPTAAVTIVLVISLCEWVYLSHYPSLNPRVSVTSTM